MSFRELLFLHINNTMAILLKTTSVRVSFIQIMQVRVQNKGNSVWKSIYDGDVSAHMRWKVCTVYKSIPDIMGQTHLMRRLCVLLLYRGRQQSSSCPSPPCLASTRV